MEAKDFVSGLNAAISLVEKASNARQQCDMFISYYLKALLGTCKKANSSLTEDVEQLLATAEQISNKLADFEAVFFTESIESARFVLDQVEQESDKVAE